MTGACFVVPPGGTVPYPCAMPVQPPTPPVRIRAATSSDLPVILAFIRELAAYEQLQHQVVATEALLQQHLFGERPVAEALLAETEGQAQGFALFFPHFSTFLGRPGIYLEDLYVRETARGRGIGKALLSRLARIAVERAWGRVEWAVLDWNAPAIGFYKGLGATILDDWRICRLTGDALVQLAGQESSGTRETVRPQD
jgi:GNAT superfamily N-acetyltransferase